MTHEAALYLHLFATFLKELLVDGNSQSYWSIYRAFILMDFTCGEFRWLLQCQESIYVDAKTQSAYIRNFQHNFTHVVATVLRPLKLMELDWDKEESQSLVGGDPESIKGFKAVQEHLRSNAEESLLARCVLRVLPNVPW